MFSSFRQQGRLMHVVGHFVGSSQDLQAAILTRNHSVEGSGIQL